MSKNTFFLQDRQVLKEKRNDVIVFLQLKDFDQLKINWFLKAYDFFCDNPTGYDGSTMTQDLDSIKGLELWSMLHDYFYVDLNVLASRHYQRKADRILRWNMEAAWASGAEIQWRMFRLFWLRGFYPWYNRVFKGRRMTAHNKIQMESAYVTFYD